MAAALLPPRCGCTMTGEQCLEHSIYGSRPPRCRDRIRPHAGFCQCDCFNCVDPLDRPNCNKSYTAKVGASLLVATMPISTVALVGADKPSPPTAAATASGWPAWAPRVYWLISVYMPLAHTAQVMKKMGAVAFEKLFARGRSSPVQRPALAPGIVVQQPGLEHSVEGGPRAMLTSTFVLSWSWYLSAGYPPARPARRG